MNTEEFEKLQAECNGLFSGEEWAVILKVEREAPETAIDAEAHSAAALTDREHEDRLSRIFAGDFDAEEVPDIIGIAGGDNDETYEAHFVAVIESIGTDHPIELEPHPREDQRKALEERLRQLESDRPAYAHRTRTQRKVVWDLLPPGTQPMAGDEVCEDGVWRPRSTLAMCTSRYDKAAFEFYEAQRTYDAVLEKHGPDALLTRTAYLALENARAVRSKALKDADDPVVQGWDRVDAHRKEHREEYNASRREREEPNADLSNLTPEEKLKHRNAQKAARKREARAKEKAVKLAAESAAAAP
ncbi:hypothetical protein ACEUZ9_002032 [Paracoccus litorisediminis]|uniref:hypothetical protein n=1 Tax=Paracoccus litorisediminis TaxID=2006130 RepID=UPI003731BF02